MSESTPGARPAPSAFAPDYVEIKQIGQGAFGRAVLVEKVTEPCCGELYVIKQINVAAMDPKARREAEQEVKVCVVVEVHVCLSGLSHPLPRCCKPCDTRTSSAT